MGLDIVFTNDSLKRNASQNIEFFQRLNDLQKKHPEVLIHYYLKKDYGDFRLWCELENGSPEIQQEFRLLLNYYYYPVPLRLNKVFAGKTDDEISVFLRCEIRQE